MTDTLDQAIIDREFALIMSFAEDEIEQNIPCHLGYVGIDLRCPNIATYFVSTECPHCGTVRNDVPWCEQDLREHISMASQTRCAPCRTQGRLNQPIDIIFVKKKRSRR